MTDTPPEEFLSDTERHRLQYLLGRTTYEVGVLKAENERLRQELREADSCLLQIRSLKAENERLRALLSWINGACVDELPHAEIRAAIDRPTP